MSFENVMFAAICWLCALIFGLIALWAFKRKTPPNSQYPSCQIIVDKVLGLR